VLPNAWDGISSLRLFDRSRKNILEKRLRQSEIPSFHPHAMVSFVRIRKGNRYIMRPVRFIDMDRWHGDIRAALRQTAIAVLDSGRYIGGEEVKAFEKEMAAWMGVAEVCGTGCGTLALFAALRGFNIGPGDEVITSVHTAIPTAEAITLTGARVVFADVEPGYYTIDPAEVERRITTRTKAIIPVHLYGHAAELDPILAVARKRGLKVIEDCAQAQGARYGGTRVGAFGDASIFSFFPSKTLGGFGDGGAVVARDPEVMKRIRMFCDHGRVSKYDHQFEGINSRLDTIQAALLRVCLAKLDGWNDARRQAARWYDEGLAGIPPIVLPKVRPRTEPVYHLYVIQAPDRESMQECLKERQIETGIHYPSSLNLLRAYAHLQQGDGSFPRAEEACRHVLSIPLYPGITREDVVQVCDAIRVSVGKGAA
jgi:dTDP-4-amino-4,6-dideoxygalactose transaminase